ncbi:hypothetical protein TDB9533_03506 [Thalassocella blandensis]|nr:hypothetical protein TDB9533_03506 [Thalassocella blandensis]
MSQHSNQQGASFSSVIQKLSSDYFNRMIGQAEYRAKRREILDQIDQYYNGAPVSQQPPPDYSQLSTAATTIPNKESLGTTMTFSVDEILGSQKKED